ncbi:MAG TPA: hypothetical protein VN805_06980 [Caulobacteraceae bacterium]|nr:hypothetical protein [Caulobacteraceae bacterium]
MRTLALAVGLAGILAAGAAHASPVQDAMTAFGLIGTWAPDCSQPPSGDNEFTVYRLESDGSVSMAYMSGPDIEPNRYRWDEAQIVSPDRIRLIGVFFGNGLEQNTLLDRRDGRIRVWSNADSSGRVLVRDGAFPSGGGPPWDQKCND